MRCLFLQKGSVEQRKKLLFGLEKVWNKKKLEPLYIDDLFNTEVEWQVKALSSQINQNVKDLDAYLKTKGIW